MNATPPEKSFFHQEILAVSPESKDSDLYKYKQVTDIQEIQNYLKLVYKRPRNVSKRFQKDISSRTKDIKQFSQLIMDTCTHGRTHRCKYRADPTRGGSAKKVKTPLT